MKNRSNGKKPQNDMRGAGFDRGSEKLRDDDDEDLGQCQIGDAEFPAQRGAVGLNFGFGRLERRIVCGRQVESWR